MTQSRTNAISMPTLDALLTEFADLADWQDRYEYLIDLGKQLKPLPDELRTVDSIVKGCQSTVWLKSEIEDVGGTRRIHLQADSDALIVKGLIVVLLAIFDGVAIEDVLTRNETAVFAQLGLDQHLSPQRRNGLFAMIKRIKQLALEAIPKG